MCLAVLGQIISIEGEDLDRMGRVRLGSTVRVVNLAYVPEAGLGDYVTVHADFAVSKLEPLEIQKALQSQTHVEAC